MGRFDQALPAIATGIALMVLCVAGGIQLGSLLSKGYPAIGGITGFFFALFVLDRLHRRS